MIGRGSYGTVYEIQRKLIDGETESAALKVITIPQNPGEIEEMYSEGYDDESITANFQAHLKSIVAEYSLMRKMGGSANVVNCKDILYIQHDDGIGWDIYIRMELLTPLMKALPIDISDETVIKVGRDICNALVLCKRHEIVHRDIKPQNIFISPNGDYKLGDFGIAKIMEKTMGGTKIGTYKYMAPEVYNNRPYGSTADIYSLGLVLYWLLNERRMPFMPLPPAKITAVREDEARQRRLSGEKIPAPAHGSAGFKQIVLKACAYEAKDRYSSAAAMLEALNALGRERAAYSPSVPAVRGKEDPRISTTAVPTPQRNNNSANARTQVNRTIPGTVPVTRPMPMQERRTNGTGVLANPPALNVPRANPPRAYNPGANVPPANNAGGKRKKVDETKILTIALIALIVVAVVMLLLRFMGGNIIDIPFVRDWF